MEIVRYDGTEQHSPQTVCAGEKYFLYFSKEDVIKECFVTCVVAKVIKGEVLVFFESADGDGELSINEFMDNTVPFLEREEKKEKKFEVHPCQCCDGWEPGRCERCYYSKLKDKTLDQLNGEKEPTPNWIRPLFPQFLQAYRKWWGFYKVLAAQGPVRRLEKTFEIDGVQGYSPCGYCEAAALPHSLRTGCERCVLSSSICKTLLKDINNILKAPVLTVGDVIRTTPFVPLVQITVPTKENYEAAAKIAKQIADIILVDGIERLGFHININTLQKG